VVNNNTSLSQIEKLMERVFDPEIPVLSIVDLGVFREVKKANDIFEIYITPTYSGCPAMRDIEDNIHKVMAEEKIENFIVKTIISPAWTTDWMSNEAKIKLKNYGIAPPHLTTEEHLTAIMSGKSNHTSCPFCGSSNTKLTSAFGSTSCKALHYCNDCDQPFEEFKCH
jgi:ring-1,2-phenylacetyl-CoA epoxidase subunit PaaD